MSENNIPENNAAGAADNNIEEAVIAEMPAEMRAQAEPVSAAEHVAENAENTENVDSAVAAAPVETPATAQEAQNPAEQNLAEQPATNFQAAPPAGVAYSAENVNGYASVSEQPQRKGLAVTSLITGIVSFLTSWTIFIGIGAGIAAVITGILAARKKQKKGLWITGIVLGAIGIIGSLIAIFVWMAIFSSAAIINSDPELVQQVCTELHQQGITEDMLPMLESELPDDMLEMVKQCF